MFAKKKSEVRDEVVPPIAGAVVMVNIGTGTVLVVHLGRRIAF